MNTETIKSIIMHELPKISRTADEVHQFILKISREQFADQSESNRRFDRMMDELAEQRKKSDKRWDENNRKWDETQRKSDEHSLTPYIIWRLFARNQAIKYP